MKKLQDLKFGKVLDRSALKQIGGGYAFYSCRTGGGSGSSSTATMAEAVSMAKANCGGGGYTVMVF